ncbi:MAG: hypothetical protein II781_00640 [Clostridia bacterium]|nr:hypothetical protein [Clostridia bacterium]
MRNWLDRIALWIRIITVPPVLVILLSLILDAKDPEFRLWCPLVFLCLLPLFSYPLCRLVPGLHKGGRKTQRSCALLFSLAGYLLYVLWCAFFGGDRLEWMMSLTYLVSGCMIALFSFCFHIFGSGHAAGVCGPAFMLAVCFGSWGLTVLLMVPFVFWSSIRLKRHTMGQLCLGGMFPVLTTSLLLLVL